MTTTTTAPPPTATTTATTADAPLVARGAGATRRLPVRSQLRRARRWIGWIPASLRTRILAWFIGALALSTLASVLVTHEVLRLRMDQRIDAELAQEAAELRSLASGNDPDTGRPFGADVERILEVFLQRNVPSRNEALVTFVDGRPFLRSRQASPYRIDTDRELVARVGAVAATTRGRLATPAGRVEYLAVPLRVEGGTRGVFVSAFFARGAEAEAASVVRALGGVGLVLILLGSILAWRLADRVLHPVTQLTVAARSISETDLRARIDVRGRDQVAQLASTFNDMLDRLEYAFGSQRQFVDDAGHELKTPITILRGHLELLDDDPAARRETVALLLDELDRMTRIVGDLLLLAKHERPDFLAVARVDVGALTEEVYGKARALASCEWVLAECGRGTIVADRQRLTQALVQLAENAVRHGAAGRPVALGSSVAGGEARFWVRDHGRGVAPGELGEIFERFRRGKGARRSDGAGLGLAIVKAIAEAHRGRVEVDSGPGEGSRFTLVVPVEGPLGGRRP